MIWIIVILACNAALLVVIALDLSWIINANEMIMVDLESLIESAKNEREQNKIIADRLDFLEGRPK